MLGEFTKKNLSYRHLLFELIKRDIKLKYRDSILGVLWSMLNPLLTMIVLSVVFSALFKKNIENFPVYVLTGRLIYSFFSESTKFAMNSIINNGKLIRKVYMPKYLFPMSKICSSFIIFLISMIPLLLVMIVTGVELKFISLLFFFPLVYIFLISIGIGLILCTITVFFRDMQHFYSIVLMVIMYLSAIFYPASIIPEKYIYLLKLNPLYTVIEMFRTIILYGNAPSLYSHVICITYSFIYLMIGILIFNKNQNKFIFYV